MPQGFWNNLKRPILALAPMADVTDAAFRRMFAECGRPDVYWTEFVSVEGLLSAGRERLLPDLWFSAEEHPIVAQIFGGKPEQFEAVGPLLKELGFDGIDINMGCPDRGVEKSGGGANLIKHPERAADVIRAAKRGAGGLPVSVKTRIGYASTAEMDSWLATLLQERPAALTVHLRTRNEMSDVPAHWELASRVVALRDTHAPETLILGNGDIASVEDARAKAAQYNLDGGMVGRGIFGNPWFFSGREPGLRERLERMIAHTELFQSLYSGTDGGRRHKGFEVMKKHYKAYVNRFEGAKELRLRLFEAADAPEVRRIAEEFLSEAGA